MIVLQCSEAIISMLLHPAHFKIPFTSVHTVADNVAHPLVSATTMKLTFNEAEKYIVICNGWTPDKENSYRISDVSDLAETLNIYFSGVFTADYLENIPHSTTNCHIIIPNLCILEKEIERIF